MDDQQQLSRRERQIMQVIYEMGEASVNDIQGRLPDPPTHTAVRTLLRILESKGQVRRRKEGRGHLYTAKRARNHAGRSALNRVITTFFDGSLERALGAHLAANASKLTDEELERIDRMISEARRKGAGDE